MPIPEYLDNINTRFLLGNATEHTFRGDLQRLIETIVPGIAATNEPKRIECGAPDYVITQKDIPVGYIEAKDVGVDLESNNLKEQRDRYRRALDNLIFTDYLDFRLYLNGEFQISVRIAEIKNGRIVPLPENFDEFTSLIKDFCSRAGQTIKSSRKLAVMMAEKSRMLAYIIKNALESDAESQANSTLKEQMSAFRQILIHDIDAKSFADIYAQTIAYGMFAARLHDNELDTFSRQEAAEKIPKTNPFLRKLFQYVAGYDLDERIKWIVDALADVFRAADVAAILKNFGKSTRTHDPIMHFYETFLAEYDPKLRKSRGVFYTPEPVVDFIVRAVDDILKTEFGLAQGLADTSKTRVIVDQQGKKVEKEVHKVQILDPATGTGTFLAQVIKQIHKGFEGQQGIWSSYVEDHLIPRLNGFELLMASYAMAHLKLDLLLTELSVGKSPEGTEIIAQGKAKGRNPGYGVPYHTDPEGVEQTARDFAPLQGADATGVHSPGFHPGLLSSSPAGTRDQRFQIYLTNSLEEYHPDTGTLWASWLSSEANEANHIKRDTPVMVVIGNPPYSGESANKGDWIMSLMEDYKKEPGGVEKLKERNPKWINDDYVKFLRYGQHFIEKKGEGVLAFINPHGFLDNPTFRGMRWNLLKTYDKIYVLDLHGNTTKQETCPDGSPDVNVFDIKQGVSINIFVKTGRKKPHELGAVHHFDLFGKREPKYEFLQNNSLSSVPYKPLDVTEPMYFMVEKDFGLEDDYVEGFSVADMFLVNGMGVTTAHDGFVIDEDRKTLAEKFDKFRNATRDTLTLHKDFDVKVKTGWDILAGYDNIKSSEDIAGFVQRYSFRPFETRFIFYEDKLVWRTVRQVMKHFLRGDNLALNLVKSRRDPDSHNYFITDSVTDKAIISSLDNANVLPLYLYPDDNPQQTLGGLSTKGTNIIAVGKAEGRHRRKADDDGTVPEDTVLKIKSEKPGLGQKVDYFLRRRKRYGAIFSLRHRSLA